MKRQAGRPAFFLRISEVAHRENLCYTPDITRTEDAMANFTKQAIKASFLKLLNQQPLNKISVRDIVEDCGINRNSFYYHFRDIPSLLGEIVAEQTEQLIRAYPSISSLDECFHVAFRFALENKRAVMHIYHSVNRDVFTQSMLRLCEYVVTTYITTAFPDDLISESDRSVVIRFMKCQLLGMCFDWFDRGMTDAAYDDLHRMLQLIQGVPELIIRRSQETNG